MNLMMLEINMLENFKNVFSVFETLNVLKWISFVIELLIMSYVIYKILMWIKNTRAWILIRGVLVIGIFIIIAVLCEFDVILYIVRHLSYIAVFGMIIIFQDDIRAGLEHLGRQRVFSKLIPDINKFTKKTSKESIQEIVEASFAMGSVRTGALMVLEQEYTLEEYERTGIDINGDVSRQLLINIFEKNTPLHDGAVLIVGDVIKSATCYLPLSHNNNISKALGTRHRAALGMSEISDAIIVVVSEETGNVSICKSGEIQVMKDEREMTKELLDIIYGHDENVNDTESVAQMVRKLF